MCGIVGYAGRRPATALLLDGLRRLEYRGYDSAGVALLEAGGLTCRKTVGRLDNLDKLLAGDPLAGRVGIGHTRWATHGEPSTVNSHPHLDGAGRIAVVHNGIIENYQELRAELEARGCVFQSQTDTEVVPHLIAAEWTAGRDFLAAVRAALVRCRGAYALGILNAAEPDVFYAARKGSPLIIGLGAEENFIASDVPAILKQVAEVVYLEEDQLARISADCIELFDLAGQAVPVQPQPLTLAAESADRAGFETFMLKEIHEQPRVLRSLLESHLDVPGGPRAFDRGDLDPAAWRALKQVTLVSCGTAYYAALYGRLLLERLTGLSVAVELGSEFRYAPGKVGPETLFLAVSQSGETADTLAGVRCARARGCRIAAICNVDGSTLVRESDAVLFTHAGPEIGVASTKAYTAQLMSLIFVALCAARARGELTADALAEWDRELRHVPDALHYVLNRGEAIAAIAAKHYEGPSSLYLGRRFNYPTALEGALKNKEISYQHAEGYAAGEMKHGPIALINEYVPVVCLCTRTEDEVYEKMISNVREVEARHGRIIAVVSEGDHQLDDVAEDVIPVPALREELSPLVNVVALQLLAYYAARARGNDIDKPRNLAKSVTVE
ncbi:MAG: glutamine--fructose-6-phosphate transaminase (isomerizing) [Candidatus Marinimicrobia bacterium]|nr:glutamine--fructose-6-phosphate transaminase (isomerizing) [Candidatus Neomarinimicrobiota bacterium]